MGNKIFVSYKYGDNNVENIIGTKGKGGLCTVRDYVDELEKTLKNKTEHIYKGESDGEDLSQLSDDTIWEKLKNRIYDSTLTIVMLSKGMREKYKAEKHQWIPQEISYSLKEISRIDSSGNSVTSKTNALIAVIIPDIYGNYDYFTYQKDCCTKKCTHYNNDSDRIFTIMSKNMFNQKSPDKEQCDNNNYIYHGECNYMLCVKWNDFVDNVDKYIDRAYSIQDNQEEYDIAKTI
ncbi:TIR domain-containing protein [Pseudoruminococcus massiliensis]|uniref:TIR domain-containing protein n=1 Tax=Pseudoruminococcus massiliensis TaxID=2086583 RepID=UPI000D0EA134|nr:TIR domain-containing protein [Pseudoruminococcus massiliensis]